eukprot:CAMPEP_0113486452 /NCGR_PEP_ID=MMETSP0014_2-20120614/25004_1 /TAXON_ID=2857 /ORGANISM="Nitzschia sp." /LENGTH=1315 /DNA_ID=CAMNT_0000380125 /DNA_START=307 /DNA_END=4254 /DNA_ORIENTATION=+ /assembly_acc=CAM_ASM_000159
MAAQDKGVLTSTALPSEDSTNNNNHQHRCHQEGTTTTTTTEIGGLVAGGGGGGDASVEAASEVSTIVSDDVPGGSSSSVVAAAQSATAVQLHGIEGPGGREQQQQHQQQKEHGVEAQSYVEENQPEIQVMDAFYDGGSHHHEDDDEALRSHNLAAAAEVETAASLGFSSTDQLEQQHLHEDNGVGYNHHDVDMTAEEVLDAAVMCDYDDGGGGGKGSLNNHSDKAYGLVNHGDPTMEDGSFVDNAMPIQPHPDDEDYNPIPVLPTTPTAAAAAAAENSRTLTSGDDGDSMLHIGTEGHDFNLGGGDSLRRKRSADDYGTSSSGYESYGSNNAGGSQDYDQLLLSGESVPKKMKMTNAQTGLPTQTSFHCNIGNNHSIKTSAAASSGTTASNPSSKKVNNEQWEAMFEKLKAYKAQNGNCLVPKRYTTDPRLGTWVETQRNQRKKLKSLGICPTTGKELFEHNNRLNAERLAKLEDIGFAWSAKHFRKNNNGKNLGGVLNVAAADSSSNLKAPPPGSQSASPSPATIPKSNVKDGNGSSGSATVVAKIKAPKGPRSSTAKAARPQQQQLQQRRPRLNETQWDDMYQRLVQYKKEHGDCLVPRKYEKDPKLAVWCEVQRSLNNQQQRNVAARANAPSPTNAPSFEARDDQGKLPATTSSPPAAEFDELSKPQSAPAASPEVPLVDVGTNSTGESMQQYLPDDDKNKGKRLTPERKQKLDELGFVWSLRTKRVEDNWNQMFQQLVAYKEEHGDCLVPSRYEANLKLAKWVETQRQESKKATDGRSTNPRLTEERKRRLESIGFEWKVKQKMKRYYDKRWDSMFDRLVAFKQANGHCMVPKRYATDPQLGTWVHTQRIQYRTKYRKPTKNVALSEEEVSALKSCGDEVTYRLTDERRQRLEDIGFVWSAREGEKGPDSGRITRNSYDDQWDSMFEQLKEYKAKFGNCLVPKRYKDNPKLGTWCDTQRVQRKKLMKKLSEKMSKTPGGNGSSEAPSETAVSRDGYESAPATSSGTSSPPNTPGSSSKPLVGRLTDERIRRLSDIGFVWEIRNDWQKHYDELKEYKKKHGHCNVPSRYAENRRLGIWVSAQRAAYKANPKATESGGGRAAPFTQERIDLLNEIGFSFSIRSRESLGESWFQRLQELKAFKEKYGHCLVPSRYTEAPGLGTWVGSQRSAYRLWKQAQASPGAVVPGSTAMNEERAKALDELGFVWVLRKKDNRNGSPTQPTNYSHNQAVSQYQNDFIHENDGFNAAQVLQVLHGGGHDLDRRNSSAGFSQSSQYQEQSIAMNQYESHIQQQQQQPQNAQSMVGPDSDQNVAI